MALVKCLGAANTKAPASIAEALVLSVVLGVELGVGVLIKMRLGRDWARKAKIDKT